MIRSKTTRIAALLLSSVATVAATPTTYEEPPILKASELAPPAMLKGPRFEVDEQVPVVIFLERFVVRSDFGAFEAHGRDMLPIRVVEVHALDQLEHTSKTKEFLTAAGRAAARPVAAAANMVTHPVDTVKGAPAAVGRFFDRVELGAEHIASATKGDAPAAEKTALVTKRVGGVTADVFGYEQERRALAKRLGVDPYTTNHVLSEKMNDVAWVAFSGRVGLNVVISVAVPFSMAISATSITNDMVWDMKPADLLNLDEQKLKEMGVPDDVVQAMLRNQYYSITGLTSFVNSLDSLRGVNGRDQVVAFAAAAGTEDRARLIVRATEMLAQYHGSVEPFTQVTAPGPIVAHTRTGALLLPAPLDYVAWTPGVARLARRPDLKAAERTVWLTGTFSPRAQRELAAAGWKMRAEPPPTR